MSSWASRRMITTGLGKSQYPARRLADTLNGIDHPAVFVHAAELAHGLYGAILPGSTLAAFSQSGQTPEVVDAVKFALRRNCCVVWVSSVEFFYHPTHFHNARVAWFATGVNGERDPFQTEAVPLESVIRQEHAVNEIVREVMRTRGEEWCRDALRANHPGGTIGQALRKDEG